jgi:cytochrome c oxidase cbb3-type subunit 3
MHAILLVSLALAFQGRSAQAADVEKGKRLYDSRCAFCHGNSGAGNGPAGAALKPKPTDFTRAEYWKSTSPEAIKAAIQNGKPNTAMLAFKNALSTEELDDLVAYMRTFAPQ